MTQTLLLYAHPAPRGSYLNRYLVEKAVGLPGLRVRDLYQLYPDFYIDAAEERRSLLDADLVLMQFPIRWFSVPSIIREWQDHVLARGFAFGPGGTALHGKRFSVIVTTGGQAASYSAGEPHGAPIEAYLEPVMQTARFCGMHVEPAFVLHGARDLDEGARAEAQERYLNYIRRRSAGGGDD
jgi:putative NADPH-quinone reductase